MKSIPFVDLHAHYLTIIPEMNGAISRKNLMFRIFNASPL